MASRRNNASTEGLGFGRTSWDAAGANFYEPNFELQMPTGSGPAGPEGTIPHPGGPPINGAWGAGGWNGGRGAGGWGSGPAQRHQPGQTVSNKPFDYEGGRDAWMSGRYSRDEAGIRQWNDEYGLLQGYEGGDTGSLANGGGLIDLLSNWGGGRGNGQAIGSTWTAAGGNGPNGNGGGGGGAGSGGHQPPVGGLGSLFDPEIMNQLKSMFPDGAFNTDLVKRRTEGAREDLQSFEKSRNASNQAQLAERGLLGDGAEATAQNRVESDIADQYSRAASQIYGDESQRADGRMMQALQMAAGLTESEASLLINQAMGNRRMDIDRELGMGNLGLQRELGYGQLGLGWGNLQLDQNQGDMDAMIRLLEQLYGGADTSSGGYY